MFLRAHVLVLNQVQSLLNIESATYLDRDCTYKPHFILNRGRFIQNMTVWIPGAVTLWLAVGQCVAKLITCAKHLVHMISIFLMYIQDYLMHCILPSKQTPIFLVMCNPKWSSIVLLFVALLQVTCPIFRKVWTSTHWEVALTRWYNLSYKKCPLAL